MNKNLKENNHRDNPVDVHKIFENMNDNLEAVTKGTSPVGTSLWNTFISIHPADIAQFLSEKDKDTAQQLFLKLSDSLRIPVFSYLSYSMKVVCLSVLEDHDRAQVLSSLPLDELTDFFDELSDEELKKYIALLHKKDREEVLSLMRFDPQSAGGIMNTDVITLLEEFTIARSIQILQRLQPNVELHQKIYVTNQENELLGHINLQDLVLKNPQTRISSILHKNDLVVKADEDQESVASQMIHYKLMTAPVVGEHNLFLGIISSDTLVDVIEQEAAEDVYKMSALAPIRHAYFDTSFKKLLYQRSSILIILFLVQIVSSVIMIHYNDLLSGFLIFFVTMIQSTGGNSSSQSSALAIQGISSGEINDSNYKRFLAREVFMAGIIGTLLAVVSFIRVYILHPGHTTASLAVSVSLGLIVVASMLLGSLIPVLLRKFKLDPALSAGPFLATLMDVLGLLIYCFISQLFLGK
ncbi:magnesium transporter [Candidatus Dependentiae bacterium]|nr:magnesium transporter [Candidatus Dependentiae bacterium]